MPAESLAAGLGAASIFIIFMVALFWAERRTNAK